MFTDLGTTNSVTSYSVYDNEKKIFYVSGVGEKDAYVATETMVYKDARLTTEVGAAEENEYKYSGEKLYHQRNL